MNEDAPIDKTVDNKVVLTANNGAIPPNKVKNKPPVVKPSKQDMQKDPTISIDDKTALLGDKVHCHVNIGASRLTDITYKAWRLGMTDGCDREYLISDVKYVKILDETGRDRTDELNIQDKDGMFYAFVKTADTQISVTGETVPDDPQPDDLKVYSEKTNKDCGPLKNPSIGQSLLSYTYQVVMLITVTEVKDNHTVENVATQIMSDRRDKINIVTNLLKEINPAKDATMQIGDDSIDGKSVYLNHTFLYRLDSSILPPDRAYQTVAD